MGQTLGKLCDCIIHIAGEMGRNDEQILPTYCWDYHPSSTLVVEEVKEPLIIASSSHLIATPGDEDEHQISETEHLRHNSDLWCKFTSSNEIVEEKQSVITISEPLVTVTKEHESKSKGVGNAPLKPVENVAVVRKKVSKQPKTIDKMIGHYRSSHKILLVGEGDFSFSACLAKAFGSASNMVATSLDSLDFLRANYPSAVSNIGYLRNNGAIVIHNLDATQMAGHDSCRFDRIIFNFPLAGFFVESKMQKLKRNRKLVRLFMKNAASMLQDKGEIHITHKSSSNYSEWDLEGLARNNHLRLIEEVEFKLSHYRGYHNKYGFGGNADFNCCPSRTYKFGRK